MARKKPGPPKGMRYGGVQKGYKAPHTMEKAAAREYVRERVISALRPMLNAQIANAMGVGHLFTRDKAGKFTRIEDEQEMERLLADGVEGEHYWIFTKDPSVQSFTDLMNRALDKPADTVDVTVSRSPRELSDEELLAEAQRLLKGQDGARVH